MTLTYRNAVVEDNIHVVFKEPLWPIFSSINSEWMVQTVFYGSTMIEISLVLSCKSSPRNLISEITKPESSFKKVKKPTDLKLIQENKPLKWSIFCLLISLLFSFGNYSNLSSLGGIWNIVWRVLVPYLLVTLLLFPKYAVKETITAVRGLGIQLTTYFNDGSKKQSFIESSSIKSIIVNEGIRYCKVKYYLAVIITGRNNMTLMLDHAMPRLPVVGYIYRNLMRVLSEPLPAVDQNGNPVDFPDL